MQKTIAFIPVRGGSKSIPKKNIIDICGKPLIYWSLRSAQKCSKIDEIIVATDSKDIKEIVNSFEFNKVKVYDRDPNNAKDISSTEDVMIEYINNNKLNGEDTFILIQATNPFLRSEDLDQALKQYNGSNSIISVVEKQFFIWLTSKSIICYLICL